MTHQSKVPRFVLVLLVLVANLINRQSIHAQTNSGVEYRVLATSKTSTMEKELNEGAEAGFRFIAAMAAKLRSAAMKPLR